MTNLVDLLSDTVYREQAVKRLDCLLGASEKFPVQKAQLYGLRQIARQEPTKVRTFANCQRERAKRKAEIDFWSPLARGDNRRKTRRRCYMLASQAPHHHPRANRCPTSTLRWNPSPRPSARW